VHAVRHEKGSTALRGVTSAVSPKLPLATAAETRRRRTHQKRGGGCEPQRLGALRRCRRAFRAGGTPNWTTVAPTIPRSPYRGSGTAHRPWDTPTDLSVATRKRSCCHPVFGEALAKDWPDVYFVDEPLGYW